MLYCINTRSSGEEVGGAGWESPPNEKHSSSQANGWPVIVTMVLVDTSVWVAHFRKSNASLESPLLNDQIFCHPLVLLELACSSPPAPRSKTLDYLNKLQQATVATLTETLAFIEKHQLQEAGWGAIDVSLLASTLLSKNARLWTLDKSPEKLADRLGVSYSNKLH